MTRRVQNSGHGENHSVNPRRLRRRPFGAVRMASLQVNELQGLKSGPGGKPRAPIVPPKLTTLFSPAGAPSAFEVRENRCETTDMASGLAAYVRSSGVARTSMRGQNCCQTRGLLEGGASTGLPRSWYSASCDRLSDASGAVLAAQVEIRVMVRPIDVQECLVWRGGQPAVTSGRALARRATR